MKKITVIFILMLTMSLTGFAQTKVATLPIKQRTLANGLRIVSVQDNNSPTVAVHVWYNVGSKDDPEGRSGFAHLFEHLMFKSSKNLKSEQFDRLTEDVGGFNNASTYDDFTNYYEVVPSNYLESILWAEAERMHNLNVDEANFKSEREVVKEEFRQRILAQPYGLLTGQYLEKLSFTTHPYRRPGIGNLDELNAASLTDVQNFYKTFYRPDNAVLIVVGDFQQTQFDNWANKYFGGVPKVSTDLPRVTVSEPERATEKRFNETAPNVPFPAVVISYLAPDSKDKDVAALKIAEKILSGGESSRLYQSLVYKEQIAQEASFNADIRADRGLLFFLAIAADGKTPDALEKSMLEELKKIQAAPVMTNELEKAKNQLITNQFRELETNDGKAIAIERAVAYDGDPNAVNSDVAKLKAVTAADVQRVMKKYFTDQNRVVIYYQNGKVKK